jgi:hypothetical protein
VHSTEGPGSPIDTLLDDAHVLTTGYDHHHAPTAAERIARAVRRRRDAVKDRVARGQDSRGQDYRAAAVRPAPARYASEHEQARYELDLTTALVINTPQAAEHLSHLVDDRQIEPEGALVFACLLHLTGHVEACRFWWQFAAGGGSHTAAYCLYLHHRRHAEFRDADYWRREAARLRDLPPERTAARPAAARRPLLPEHIRRDLLAQCHRGAHPHLPAALEAVINQLKVDDDDLDFGEIPQPSPRLTTTLTARA